MKKRIVLCVCGALLFLFGCGATSEKEVVLNKEPIPVGEKEVVQKEEPIPVGEKEIVQNEEPVPVSDISSTRKDGERFEDVIILEGTEEPVKYEHAINDAIGIEIDFEYESLARKSESDKESFISIYDDPDNPDNYLEITYGSENMDAVTASISKELSKEYEIQTGTLDLENAGACTTIDTVSGGSGELLRVYLVPSGEGTIVATAHFTFESAEGFGHRFDQMLGTLVVR